MVNQLHHSDISHFIREVGNNAQVILDIGSRHSLEAVEFSKSLPESNVYCFEPNPDSYITCLENTKGYQNIEVFQIAASDKDGMISFFAIDPDKTITSWFDGNLGASSMYKANGSYPYEKYHQKEIEVEQKRIDTWCNECGIGEVDAVWMDVQGHALSCLEGFGDVLDTVRVIQVELEHRVIYEGQCLFPEVNDYLINKGFILKRRMGENEWSGDYIYARIPNSNINME